MDETPTCSVTYNQTTTLISPLAPIPPLETTGLILICLVCFAHADTLLRVPVASPKLMAAPYSPPDIPFAGTTVAPSTAPVNTNTQTTSIRPEIVVRRNTAFFMLLLGDTLGQSVSLAEGPNHKTFITT